MGNIASHDCANHFEVIQRERDFPIHGTTVPVTEEIHRCTLCGEEEYSYAQAIEAERRAGEIYRARNGFLHPDQISALRRNWGVTQSQLEAALGLGRKTVARWEAGRVLQSRAMDNLLRAIDHLPAVLGFLAGRQGLTLEARHGAAEPEVAPAGLMLPKSLLARLEVEAREEGVPLESYAVMLLSHGVERRSTHREVDRMNRKLDDVLEHASQWERFAGPMEPAEPWLRDHQEQQRNREGTAFAL